METELSDRLWLNRWFREQQAPHPVSADIDPQAREIGVEWERQAYEGAYAMLERFGHEALVNAEGLAFLLGALSALRWMRGEDWDTFYETEWDEDQEPFVHALEDEER